MIALFLLIFAFQNVQSTEEANLRQLVNSLQMNMNEMSSKMTSFETKVQSLENEIKARVVFETVKTKIQLYYKNDFLTENHSYQEFEN